MKAATMELVGHAADAARNLVGDGNRENDVVTCWLLGKPQESQKFLEINANFGFDIPHYVAGESKMRTPKRAIAFLPEWTANGSRGPWSESRVFDLVVNEP